MKLNILIIGLCIGITAFSQAKEKETGTSDLPKETQSVFNQAALKCTGFIKYSTDFRSVQASDNGDVFYDGSYQTGLKSLEIKVKDQTEVIPADFNANGQTCTYTFTKDDERIIVMKDACISICEGTLIKNNGNNFEKN